MKQKKNIFKSIVNYDQFGLIIGLILVLVLAWFVTPDFFSANAISSMLTNNSVYAILTIGVMVVILTGGIDISIGAILAISGVTVTGLMADNPGVPAFLWVLLGIGIGALCGLVNGFFIGKMKMVPMIVTLATQYIFRGFAFVISGGEWIFPHRFTESFTGLTQTKVFAFDHTASGGGQFDGITTLVFWVIGLYILGGLFLAYTKLGRKFYAIGTSPESAPIAGINEANTKVFAYTICGACAGLAGVLYSSNYAMVNSDIGSGYELTAIAICILGGVSIAGGRGRIDGVVIAVILMSVITFMLSMVQGFSVWQMAFQGAIIIVAVIINLTNGKLADRRALKERGKRI